MMHSQPVALVTGGSRGIGRGICLELGRQGYAVAINYAGNAEAARETQQLLGTPTATLLAQADLAKSADRLRAGLTYLSTMPPSRRPAAPTF
jgi:3-oxoacyl-[acyl-carrier protein] reductase